VLRSSGDARFLNDRDILSPPHSNLPLLLPMNPSRSISASTQSPLPFWIEARRIWPSSTRMLEADWRKDMLGCSNLRKLSCIGGN